MAPSKSRTKPRSPAPLRTPTTPSQYFPPSYFAAAAGVPYPPGRDDDGTAFRTPLTPRQQEPSPFSSNAPYECVLQTSSQARRRSRLGDLDLMEPHLLPTLSDTVERMTRPPSQVITSSPCHPLPGPDYSSGVARASSIASQSSAASFARSEPHSSTAVTSQTPIIQSACGKQTFLRSPSSAPPEPPLSSTRSPSSRTNPKSILKAHTISDQHLQVRQAHLDDVRPPTDHTRKAGRSPIPVPPEPLPSECKIEHRQMATSPRPKIDSSLRTGRARSRTDPGIPPKGLPATHGRNTQQSGLQPSGIPRRVGIPPSPATSRIPTVAQMSNINPETETTKSTQCGKRRLFVTNAEISSSSSSEYQTPLTRFTIPKALSRTDSQSSTESQLRPPRFGLGLGLSGVSESRNLVKLSPAQKWTTKIPIHESLPRHVNPPSIKRQQRDGTPKKSERLPSRSARVDSADGQRRKRELLSLMHADGSSGCDSQPSSSEGSDNRCLVSDESGDSLRSGFGDSGSEYSPAEEADHTAHTLTRPMAKQEQTRSKATIRQSRRVNLPGADSG